MSPKRKESKTVVNIKRNQQLKVLFRDSIIFDLSIYAFCQRAGIATVAGKDVPSADHQSLIPVTKAKCKNRSPIVLRPLKQKLKESAEDEFVPSPAIFADVVRSCLLLSRARIYLLS